MSLELWTLPKNYCGQTWPEYYVFLGRNRDSDCITRSNFRVALEKLGGESDTVFIVHEGHSFCGWVEWIAIHKKDDVALALAEKMQEKIESYPVLNEDDLCELEHKEANETWKKYSDSERVEYVKKNRNHFEFSDFADLLGCCRGKYFAGCIP